jgi:hypothetical protein
MQRVWQRLPEPVRNGARTGWGGYARLTSRGRLLPDFLIVGTQRGGTTSLYKYLVRHPAVRPALTKELRFFDLNYRRGVSWYRSRFPSARHRDLVRRRRGIDILTGESSPDYMFNPHVPSRVASLLPHVKLIVLLRNPVDRAYSHYWHQVHRGFEQLPFDEAVAREPERLAGELERVLSDDRYVSFARHHHSYLTRGRYAEQLEWWLAHFARGQVLIERSEDFFSDPGASFRGVVRFLGLPAWEPARYEVYNAFTDGAMDQGLRARLVEFFRPHNRRLEELLGRRFDWDA